MTEEDREDLRLYGSIGAYAAPVVVAHILFIYALISAITGFSFPSWLNPWRLMVWFAANGAAIAILSRSVRQGRIPYRGQVWLRGWRGGAAIGLFAIASGWWIFVPN